MTQDDIRRAIRERDGYCCTECGRTNEAHLARYDVQFHCHRAVKDGPYSLENCVTLCKTCHSARHRGEPRALPDVKIYPRKNGTVYIFRRGLPPIIRRRKPLARLSPPDSPVSP